MHDWLILTRLGPTRVFVVRNCTREDAIQHVANEADFEYHDDMSGDYVEVAKIEPGTCVEVEIEAE